MVRAFLKRSSTPGGLTGWRGLPLLVALAVILATVPQARTLITGGILGGIVIGAFLILIRHQPGSHGPRRGTPVVLFPRTADASTSGAGGV
jgi:hypothetical protein